MSRTSLADKILPERFQDELDRILNQYNGKVHSITKGIPRDCSPKTRLERRSNLRRCFAELYELGFRLESPTSLKQKHAHALACYWREKGLSAKTIHGLFSNLREFCRWINKRGVVLDIYEYFKDDHELIARKTAAQEDLSWESRGIDLNEIFSLAKEIDPRFELLLRLMRNFGLRVKEAIEFRPAVATVLDDEHLLVTHGTKGGKQRIVKIRNERQRQVLQDAKAMVHPHINSRIRWPDKTWKQAQAHFYHLMRRIAATKDLLDISAHGLRHAFLQEEYQLYSGVPAPIKGSTDLPNHAEHQRAMLAVSMQAGHYRPSISTSYCGSFGHGLRKATKSAVLPLHNHQLNEKDDAS